MRPIPCHRRFGLPICVDAMASRVPVVRHVIEVVGAWPDRGTIRPRSTSQFTTAATRVRVVGAIESRVARPFRAGVEEPLRNFLRSATSGSVASAACPVP